MHKPVIVIVGMGPGIGSAVTDTGDPEALSRALATLEAAAGGVTVLLSTAAHIKWKNLLEETAQSLVEDFRVNVAGALTAVRTVLPAMQLAGRGTILLTSSLFATRPVAQFGSLSFGKAGLRSMAYSLAEALKGTNIHVATLTVQGQVRSGDPHRSPQAIAAACWQLHVQKSGAFATEVDC